MPAIQPSYPALPRAIDRAQARSSASQARRRGALLGLARRHGEVRVVVRSGGKTGSSAVSVLELLDELNERGLLSYGGFGVQNGDSVFTYMSAA